MCDLNCAMNLGMLFHVLLNIWNFAGALSIPARMFILCAHVINTQFGPSLRFYLMGSAMSIAMRFWNLQLHSVFDSTLNFVWRFVRKMCMLQMHVDLSRDRGGAQSTTAYSTMGTRRHGPERLFMRWIWTAAGHSRNSPTSPQLLRIYGYDEHDRAFI